MLSALLSALVLRSRLLACVLACSRLGSARALPQRHASPCTPRHSYHHDIHHGSPSPARYVCDIINTPTRPRCQPLRLRTCTDFDRWTGGVKHRLAHLACAALLSSTWLLFCALFSRLCSGSQLLGSRLFRSRVAALPGSRLCSPTWLSLF